jgi:copper(I)-binding protein
MKSVIAAGALALAFAVAVPASAAEYKVGEITIVNPWARATAGIPRNGAAYLTIKGGAGDDELAEISTMVAKRAQLHGHKHEGGVMKMHEVNGFEVPAGATLTLKPGGHHIMLMKLNHALKKGQSFPLTLEFAKAGKITVEVMIMGVGARSSGMNHGHKKKKE